MDHLQTPIQNLLDQKVASGEEKGAQVAAHFRGELVIDAFAGLADSQMQKPVTGETLFPVFSTTKGVLATIIHRLVERETLDYDRPIAADWPEFGAQGKGNITVRHALTHTAGLPYIPSQIGLHEMGDWDVMCAAIADSKPVSAPNERTEYHAITFGWILGELAIRATNRPFADLWRDEICAPLGVENEMFCGLPAEFDSRVAILDVTQNLPAELPTENEPQAIPVWLWPFDGWMNRAEARRAGIPASNGIMNARAIARHYAALLPGGVEGVEGVELLPPSRVARACERVKADADDEISSFGLGYQVGNPAWSNSLAAFGHGGHGGSLGFADPQSGWAVGFTRNRFGETNVIFEVLELLKNCA